MQMMYKQLLKNLFLKLVLSKISHFLTLKIMIATILLKILMEIFSHKKSSTPCLKKVLQTRLKPCNTFKLIIWSNFQRTHFLKKHLNKIKEICIKICLKCQTLTSRRGKDLMDLYRKLKLEILLIVLSLLLRVQILNKDQLIKMKLNLKQCHHLSQWQIVRLTLLTLLQKLICKMFLRSFFKWRKSFHCPRRLDLKLKLRSMK